MYIETGYVANWMNETANGTEHFNISQYHDDNYDYHHYHHQHNHKYFYHDYLAVIDGLEAYNARGVPEFHEVVGDVLAVGSIVANVLSIVAIRAAAGGVRRWNASTSLSVNLRIIVSLCASDALTGLSVLIQNVGAEPFNTGEAETCALLALRRLKIASHLVTLLNLLLLAVDHYFAICRPLQHLARLTPGRIDAAVAALWMFAVVSAFADFVGPLVIDVECRTFLPVGKEDFGDGDGGLGYCHRIWCTMYNSEQLVLLLAVLVLVAMAVLYGLICRRIYAPRRVNGGGTCSDDGVREDRGDGGGDAASRIRRLATGRNLRALVTTACILGVYVGCWLPYVGAKVFVRIFMATLTPFDEDGVDDGISASTSMPVWVGRLEKTNNEFFYQLVVLSGLVDAFVYAVRMPDVRRGYRKLVGWAAMAAVGGRRGRRQWRISSAPTTTGSASLNCAGSLRGGGGPWTSINHDRHQSGSVLGGMNDVVGRGLDLLEIVESVANTGQSPTE